MRRLLAVACAVLALAACRDDKAQPPVVAPAPGLVDSADQFLIGVQHNLTGESVKRGELVADTGFVLQEGARMEFRKVRIDFNTPQGVKSGHLTAQRGSYHVHQNRFEAFGNVVLVGSDGRKITSPQLRYDQNANEITTDSAFVFEDAKQIQRGTGLRTDPNLTFIEVKSKWSGIIRKVPVPQVRQ